MTRTGFKRATYILHAGTGPVQYSSTSSSFSAARGHAAGLPVEPRSPAATGQSNRVPHLVEQAALGPAAIVFRHVSSPPFADCGHG